ncbi:hypothetical protein KEM48_013684 [Puccinia striiformis f. sp. tritici PST-130]|nr:hypothetical protein KEM48_013684 [Puccinia striiformis f. sp. tritici PST-130]
MVHHHSQFLAICLLILFATSDIIWLWIHIKFWVCLGKLNWLISNVLIEYSVLWGGGGGGGQGRAKKNAKKKGQTMVTDMEVELEDIYIGRSIDFEISRRVLCPACKGNGARKQTDITECETCGGQGVRIIRHQLGPGIFQQMQMQCDACGGRGQTIKHKCPSCNGHRTVEEVNSLTLDIDRGSPDGHEEVFEGEGDEGPGYSPGDVVLRIRIKKQADGGFRRLEENLYWKKS